MAGISSLNQGHLHPRIKKALINQLDNLTTIARVYHHDRYGLFCEYINKTFGYDRVIKDKIKYDSLILVKEELMQMKLLF